MKKLIILLFCGVVCLTGCTKGSELEPEGYIMTMTTKYSNVYIAMYGTGSVIIDWGDGTPKEMYEFTASLYSINLYINHYYSKPIEHTIKIIGKNIEKLFVDNITTLDVSNNPKLKLLNCYFCQFTTLDVSNNPELTSLSCSFSQLTTLDVSNNTELTSLFLKSNQLTSLDVSKNINLTYLNCTNNRLTNLDVSKNTELSILACEYNELTSLNMNGNAKLNLLYCMGNQLSATALNDLFESLHSNILENSPWEKGISMFDNPGWDDCNVKIAKDKGWSLYPIRDFAY